MLGLNIPERNDGDSRAVSLSDGRCRLESCGDSRTGDGERLKPGESGCAMSVNGEDGDRVTYGCVARPRASLNGDTAAGTATKGDAEPERDAACALSVGLRAKSEPTGLVPWLGGPMTAGVKELAEEPDLVVSVSAGLTTRGESVVRVPGGLRGCGEVVGDSTLTEDRNLEVLIGVLGRGLCITGGEDI